MEPSNHHQDKMILLKNQFAGCMYTVFPLPSSRASFLRDLPHQDKTSSSPPRPHAHLFRESFPSLFFILSMWFERDYIKELLTLPLPSASSVNYLYSPRTYTDIKPYICGEISIYQDMSFVDPMLHRRENRKRKEFPQPRGKEANSFNASFLRHLFLSLSETGILRA